MKTMTYLLNLTLVAICTQFAFADAPGWEDNPGGYQFTATVNAAILDDGTHLGDPGDIFASFDDAGNVRGIGTELSILAGDNVGLPYFEMTVRSSVACTDVNYNGTQWDESDDYCN